MENKNYREAAFGQSTRGYMPLVYVCSKFRGEVEKNVSKARAYCRFTLDHGAIPFAPHLLYPQFMDDTNPAERDLAVYKINYVFIGKADELWVFGTEISEGMQYEIETAKRQKKKIRYFTEDLKEVEQHA